MLAIARVIGETAPLLIIAGFTRRRSTPTCSTGAGRAAGLHLLPATPAGPRPRRPRIDRAWGAALVLILIVMVLNLVARVARAAASPPRPAAEPGRTDHHGQAHRRLRPEHLLRRLPRRRGRHLTIEPRSRHRVHRPVRLRQVDVPALAEPDARGDPRRPRRGQGRSSTARTSTTPASTRSTCAGTIGMVFQRPNPFPTMSIYDNVAGRAPAEQQAADEGRGRRGRGAARCRAPTSGTRSRTGSASPASGLSGGQQQRLCIARAIAVEPAGAADGRAVLGARPDLHAGHRGPDRRAQDRLHDRDRHPQHAAGGPGLGATPRSSTSPAPASPAGWSR